MFDEIGYWSEIKLDIVREYAAAYSTILTSYPNLYHIYIDAFSGAGYHISRTKNEFVPGSPLNALNVSPKFREFHLIDLEGDKIDVLNSIIGNRPDVHTYKGDCNKILLTEVFPKVTYQAYRRGMCLLDPYGLHLSWDVIRAAGQMKTIDVFLNFPIMDMNRNTLWKDPERVDDKRAARMTFFWGDESWRELSYSASGMLFDDMKKKEDNETIAEGFRQRLKDVAGFKNVPKPLPMRNTVGATVYYLFFASQNDAANKIVQDIFEKYKDKRG